MLNIEERRIWTVSSLLRWGTDRLKEKEIGSQRITIELLLAHVLRCKRLDLYTGLNKPLSQSEVTRFNILLDRRLSREPVHYILGETEFMGLSFVVDGRVLIPRPETEVLVEQAVKITQDVAHESPILVLDIGTGCGNVAVGLAKLVQRVTVTATDVSRAALEVAKINVERHGVGDRVHLMEHDVFGSVDELVRTPFDMILSNPPYISSEEASALPAEILRFEPREAVLEGGDGLSFYRRIRELAVLLMKKGGWVLVETAYNQGPAVKSIFSDAGFQGVELIRDYDGNDRVVKAQRGS